MTWSNLALLASDAKWHEEDHPRGQPKNKGQFARGQGGAGPSKQTTARPKQTGSKSKAAKREVVPPPSLDEQVEMARYVCSYMRQVSKMSGPGQPNRDRFVLEKGSFYPVTPKTYEGKRGEPHHCFMNATHDALNVPGRTYVEGYMVIHGVPIHHAWTVDEEGNVYDTTVPAHGKMGGYFGVPFTREYLIRSTLENKVYGLLGHESKKTFGPLLKGEARDYKQRVNLDKIGDDVVAARMKFAEASTADVRPTDEIDTPERHEMRAKIADKVYGRGIEKRARERKCTIILGLPGAGKSSIIGPLLDSGYLELDADLAKEEIPEFHGGQGTQAVHEESSIINRQVLGRALENGDNIAWARIDSLEKITKDVTSLRDLGYTVNVVLIDVTPETATKSAIGRFLNTNRYVPPKVIESYGNSPTETFNAVNKTGMVANSEHYRREFGKGPVKVR